MDLIVVMAENLLKRGLIDDSADFELLIREYSAKNKKFVPPTLEEVTEYFHQLNLEHPLANAIKFWNHYETNGWMRGKAKIKNWRACVKTWDIPVKGPARPMV